MGMDTLHVRIEGVRPLAEGIVAVELAAADGGALPAFDAGAHIDLHLPEGLSRSYSLCGAPGDTRHYRVAVHRDPNSRGGSAYVHDKLQAGSLLEVSPPRNQFQLDEGEHASVLIAGGIGVTPLYCMAQRLGALGHPWQMHFAARSRRNAAFLEQLQSLAARSGASLHTYFNDEAGATLPDLGAIVGQAPAGAHFYCCGPASMLEAYRQATSALPAQRVHLEHFGAAPAAAAALGGFQVELARTGKVLTITPGTTILDAMIIAGVPVDYSCTQGVCGSCQTPVLAGEPDHRDFFLTPAEQAQNTTMMVCCSGSRSARLVLDR